MATWTSLAVLSLAVVSTLSFPRPGAEYKIPTVGLGARAQYYVLHSDGTYKYGYDSGDGLFEQSMAQAPGEVSGAFGYKDPSGTDIKLEYTADDRGFIATGAHLPVAPEGDFGSRVTGTASTGATRGAATSYTAASSSAAAQATSAVRAAAVPSAPVEVAQVRSSLSDDGSYSFGYETSSSSRAESADAHNSVRGQYAFVADDGINREIQYIAGAETGYIAEGDSLPIGPSVPGAESGIPTGRILPILSEEEANALAAATSGSSIATAYTAGSSSASTSPAAYSGAAASTKSAATRSSDASYSFGYDAGDSARQESADADLNIEGTYSFVPPEGHRLTVNYFAGSDTGFVATGDHLPVAPVVDSSSGVHRAAAGSAGATYSASSAAATRSSSAAATRSSSAATAAAASAPIEVANIRSSSADDGSYNFAYDTSSSSRSESGDAHNSVRGHYAFVADDGINREIKYTAGAETGYIAEGDSLPIGPSVPGAESGIPTGRIFPILSEEEANALAAATSGSSSATTYTAGSSSASTSSATFSSAAASTKSAATSSSDASYSFGYDAGDSTRQESADADLNIEGSYSFTPPEGHRLTVNYIAGSNTGFVATGDHLPVAPEATQVAAGVVPYSAPHAAATSPVATSASASGFSAPSPSAVASTKSAATGSSDASYSFSYDAGDSSRQESADADLNVEGTYSFVPPQGHRLTVNYIAGSDTGFVATGDHLPVAPDADIGSHVSGAASGSAAATYSATSGATSSGSSTSAASASGPIEVAQVRSSSADDGSYSFAYKTASSSRSESADAQNSVTGEYSFVADDGINRAIKYIAGSETGYIAEGDSLPIGPAVPGAESGIPTGRILPILSEEEANALAAGTSVGGASPLLKSGAGSSVASADADASYSFSFASDSYSRNEEADSDGNIVGSYTFLDEEGKEHTVNFVAGRETGFQPEGYPIPTPASASRAAHASAAGAASAYSSASKTGSTSTTHTSATKSSAPASSATKYSSAQRSSAQRTSSSAGHTSQIVGDVLLHQYDAVNRDKYGYVFTALRR